MGFKNILKKCLVEACELSKYLQENNIKTLGVDGDCIVYLIEEIHMKISNYYSLTEQINQKVIQQMELANFNPDNIPLTKTEKKNNAQIKQVYAQLKKIEKKIEKLEKQKLQFIDENNTQISNQNINQIVEYEEMEESDEDEKSDDTEINLLVENNEIDAIANKIIRKDIQQIQSVEIQSPSYNQIILYLFDYLFKYLNQIQIVYGQNNIELKKKILQQRNKEKQEQQKKMEELNQQLQQQKQQLQISQQEEIQIQTQIDENVEAENNIEQQLQETEKDIKETSKQEVTLQSIQKNLQNLTTKKHLLEQKINTLLEKQKQLRNIQIVQEKQKLIKKQQMQTQLNIKQQNVKHQHYPKKARQELISIIHNKYNKKIKQIQTPYEADYQLHALYATKQINAIVSNDSDQLILGCKNLICIKPTEVIQKFFLEQQIQQAQQLQNIYQICSEALRLQDQFQEQLQQNNDKISAQIYSYEAMLPQFNFGNGLTGLRRILYCATLQSGNDYCEELTIKGLKQKDLVNIIQILFGLKKIDKEKIKQNNQLIYDFIMNTNVQTITQLFQQNMSKRLKKKMNKQNFLLNSQGIINLSQSEKQIKKQINNVSYIYKLFEKQLLQSKFQQEKQQIINMLKLLDEQKLQQIATTLKYTNYDQFIQELQSNDVKKLTYSKFNKIKGFLEQNPQQTEIPTINTYNETLQLINKEDEIINYFLRYGRSPDKEIDDQLQFYLQYKDEKTFIYNTCCNKMFQLGILNQNQFQLFQKQTFQGDPVYQYTFKQMLQVYRSMPVYSLQLDKSIPLNQYITDYRVNLSQEWQQLCSEYIMKGFRLIQYDPNIFGEIDQQRLQSIWTNFCLLKAIGTYAKYQDISKISNYQYIVRRYIQFENYPQYIGVQIEILRIHQFNFDQQGFVEQLELNGLKPVMVISVKNEQQSRYIIGRIYNK